MSFYKEATGYLIHQRSFKDSSLIIEFFSKEYGMFQLIAKGIKKNKLVKSQLQFFDLLKIQFFGKSQLKTVVSVNSIRTVSFKGLIEKTSGFYLNELIHYSLIENEVAEPLFDCYANVLSRLGSEKLTPLLRMFEKHILKFNGFELNVDSFNQLEMWLGVDENIGLITANNTSQRVCMVEDLKKFINQDRLDREAQQRINKVMMKLVDMSVSFKRLYSRELLISLTKNN
jgi:DNA repair protein RecO (recombination protein O)